MKVDGFDWDEGNKLKSEAKHGISHKIIERLFEGNFSSHQILNIQAVRRDFSQLEEIRRQEDRCS